MEIRKQKSRGFSCQQFEPTLSVPHTTNTQEPHQEVEAIHKNRAE